MHIYRCYATAYTVSLSLFLMVSDIICRVFLIFYIITSVIVVAGAIGNFGSVKMEMAFEKRKIDMLKREFDMDALMEMDANGE